MQGAYIPVPGTEARLTLSVELEITGSALLFPAATFQSLGLPTRGSLLIPLSPRFARTGEQGTHFERVMALAPHVHKREVALAMGNSGDVYLCHPFLVHAASWPHRGAGPRFISQPELPPATLLQIERPDADYSPVEIGIRLGLGLDR